MRLRVVEQNVSLSNYLEDCWIFALFHKKEEWCVFYVGRKHIFPRQFVLHAFVSFVHKISNVVNRMGKISIVYFITIIATDYFITSLLAFARYYHQSHNFICHCGSTVLLWVQSMTFQITSIRISTSSFHHCHHCMYIFASK